MAANTLGVSDQTVRNYVKKGTLAGDLVKGGLQVDAASVQAHMAKFGRKRRRADTGDADPALAVEVQRLADVVARLEERVASSFERTDALERERD